jgi:hypothetical protein
MRTLIFERVSQPLAKLAGFALLSFFALSSASAQTSLGTARVQHAPSVNGTVEGSVHQMLPEWVTLNSGARITGDLLVPGTPTITLNGSPVYGGTINGSGSASPTNYGVMLNSGSTLGRLVRRTTALTLPTIPALPAPTGSASVTVNTTGQSINWTTLRNLTLNSNVGSVTVPAGTYGNLSANSGTGFVLGVSGATQPAIYNFQNLTLNGNSTVTVVGPVVLNLANGFAANGNFGPPGTASWLTLNIRSGGLTLNSGSSLHGFVTAPSGTVIINGNAQLIGGVTSDRLTINSGGLLRLQSQTAGNIAPTVSITAPTNSSSLVSPASFSIQASASDPDGSVAKVEFFQNGTLLGEDLSAPYSFSISALAVGVYDFTARATDNSNTSTNSTAVRVTVVPANTAPTASPQNLSVAEDTSLPVVLAAVDAEGNPLTYTIVNPPAHGSLAGTAPNAVYTPNANFHGVDTFTFKANDGTLDSASAAVTITVTPVNDPAVPQPQSLALSEDSSLPVTLNATDVDGPSLSYSVTALPAHGTLGGTAPNLVYVPVANFFGTDSFNFGVTDGLSPVATATIQLTVSPVNDAPIAQALSVSVTAGESVQLILSGADVDGDPITYAVLTPPAHGMLAGTAPSLTYTPSVEYQGTDSFTYRATDGSLDSAPVTVSLTVLPRPNTAPVANSQAVLTDEDSSIALTLSGTDAESDPLSFTITVPPSHGSLSGTAPALVYSPSANYHGPDSFSFRVNDGTVDSAAGVVSITINPVNDAPVALDQTVVGTEDTAAEFDLLVSDVEGDSLTFVPISAPLHGTLSVVSTLPGQPLRVRFVPTSNFSGQDTFTYRVNDGSLDSLVATVTVTIGAANDAPVANAQTVALSEDEAQTLTLTGSDPEGDALAFTILSQPSHGALTGTAPALTYQPLPNFHGEDSFSFLVSDGSLSSEPVTVSLSIASVNDAPTAQPQSVTTSEDIPVSLTLSAADIDGDALSWTIVAQPTHGTLTGTAPNYTYTPNANYAGTDSFVFKVSDGVLESTPATVDVTVTPVNDAPTAQPQSVTTSEGTSRCRSHSLRLTSTVMRSPGRLSLNRRMAPLRAQRQTTPIPRTPITPERIHSCSK